MSEATLDRERTERSSGRAGRARAASASGLSGRQKAAVLLISLGAERAANVLKHLGEREVESLSAEMAALWRVRPETSAAVMREVEERLVQQRRRWAAAWAARSSPARCSSQLVGAERAEEIIGDGHHQARDAPVRVPAPHAARAGPRLPQGRVAADHRARRGQRALDPRRARAGRAPPELQADVALRIATMSETNPDVIRDIEQGLRLKLANVVGQEFAAAGGVDALAEILNRAGRSTERNVVGAISESDQELADEIKLRLFTFEDLVILEDRDLQLVLREVDQKELQLALRGVEPARRREDPGQHVPARRRDAARGHGELGARSSKAVVEEAQGKVVAAVRRLEDAGALVIRRGAEEEEEVV